MHSSFQRRAQDSSENEENICPNIGELSKQKKAELKSVRGNLFGNSTDNLSCISKKQKNHEKLKDDTIRQFVPLVSSRDPRRLPLVNRLPFAPVLQNHSHTRKNSKSTTSSRKFHKLDIIPAYAFKNNDSGLLEVRSIHPPTPSHIAREYKYENKDGYSTDSKSVGGKKSQNDETPALYPIAINGGGIGIYKDPGEFASGRIGASSYNQRDGARAPLRSFTAFPLNSNEVNVMFQNKKHFAKIDPADNNFVRRNCQDSNDPEDMVYNNDDETDDGITKDVETGFPHCLDGQEEIHSASAINNISENFECEGNNEEVTFFSPWKTWEKVHNYMIQLTKQNQDEKIEMKELTTDDTPFNFLVPMQTNEPKRKARISSVYNHDDYDFALVLKPREVYAYWANLLDFRGENGIFEDEDECKIENKNYDSLRSENGKSHQETQKQKTQDKIGSKLKPIDSKPFLDIPHEGFKSPENDNELEDTDNDKDVNFDKGSDNLSLIDTNNKINHEISPKSQLKRTMHSPIEAESLMIDKKSLDSTIYKSFTQSPSLFQRAIAVISPKRDKNFRRPKKMEKFKNSSAPKQVNRLVNVLQDSLINSNSARNNSTLNVANSICHEKTKRRLDNELERHDNEIEMLGPHLKHTKINIKENETLLLDKGVNGNDIENDPEHKRKRQKIIDLDEIKDIPSQTIPRGIAARINGIDRFLTALRQGFVVRHHLPGVESAFVKIVCTNGGDNIKYEFVSDSDALIALKEQNLRYNPSINHHKQSMSKICLSTSKRWSIESESISSHVSADLERDIHNFSLPDYVAAEKYRDSRSRESKGLLQRWSENKFRNHHQGEVLAQKIVAVHPAINDDPFSLEESQHGTSSLRASPSDYLRRQTFSLVFLSGKNSASYINGGPSIKSASERWYAGVGTEKFYQYLDIETATEGEYWLLFRGFLLLHRDAIVGRFAAERSCGFSSNYNACEIEQHGQKLKKEEFSKDTISNENLNHKCKYEPEEKSLLEKLVIHFKSFYVDELDEVKSVKPNPPPSDYFLGFKSPGTQIWGRLRLAGLETQRLYALDHERVMLKLKCPHDRLVDVAEVLRLKIKTKDGYFSTFQRNSRRNFMSSNDELGVQNCSKSSALSIFRSSERQQVIDFLINSRVRDSGAELGERTGGLGRDIISRVPLHMHARLEMLFNSWVLYYKRENFMLGRDFKSMMVGHKQKRGDSSIPIFSSSNIEREHYRSNGLKRGGGATIFHRYIIASFYQPLDSIEQYYGETIVFYFAWLQHCSLHLLFLSFLGIIVFLCQVGTGRLDHAIRPYFASIVMIWSFIVMINWRKRQNYLAHRWGTLNYKEEERTRPQFHGVYKKCEITKEWIREYPSWKRLLKYSLSLPITLVCSAIILLVILIAYSNRDIILARYFNDNNDGTDIFLLDWSIEIIGSKRPLSAVSLSKEHIQDPKFWFINAGFPVLLGLVLPISNYIFMKVSVILNDFENYRTDSHYRNALIIKIFTFRFVSSFASLYYYAFVSVGTEKESVENGILRVATSMFIYLTVSHWWGIILDVYFPLMCYRWRLYQEKRKLRYELRKLETMELEMLNQSAGPQTREKLKLLINKRILLDHAQNSTWVEVMLPTYDPFFDYVTAIVQFAYVVCFSSVFPLTPFIVLVNNLLSMRLNGFKICRGRRRPLSKKSGGIGVWENVLHLVTIVAILTNCSLMALTSFQFHRVLEAAGELGILVVIIGWEHLMLLVKYTLESCSSKYPKSVLDSLAQEAHEINRRRNIKIRSKKDRRSNHYPIPAVRASTAKFSMAHHSQQSITSGSTESTGAKSKKFEDNFLDLFNLDQYGIMTPSSNKAYLRKSPTVSDHLSVGDIALSFESSQGYFARDSEKSSTHSNELKAANDRIQKRVKTKKV